MKRRRKIISKKNYRNKKKVRKKRRRCSDNIESPCRIPFVPLHTLENTDYETPRLQNTVSVIDTKTKVDQTEISQVLCSFEHVRDKFAAMTLRFMETGTGLYYTTGKFILVGTPSEYGTHVKSNIYLMEIGKVRTKKFIFDKNGNVIDIQMFSVSQKMKERPRLSIENTVFKCHFNKDDIFLDELHKNTQEISAYAPESFPGVRIKEKECSFLVFQQGCCLILGLQNSSGLKKAYQKLKFYIEQAKRTKESANVIKKYIWEQNNKPRRNKNKKLELMQLKKTKKMKEQRITENRKRSKNENFQQRLMNRYDSGKFIHTEKTLQDGIEEEVCHSLSLDDFSARMDSFQQRFSMVA